MRSLQSRGNDGTASVSITTVSVTNPITPMLSIPRFKVMLRAFTISSGDGLTLHNAYITAVAHCAPPANKPAPEEMRNCRPYFERELDLLTNLKVLVALGKIAFDQYLDVLKARGVIPSRAPFTFGHNREYSTGSAQPRLISSYHPSQQNTSTGKLTEKMLREVFQRARDLAA